MQLHDVLLLPLVCVVGQWRGLDVAVKVIEFSVIAGQQGSMSAAHHRAMTEAALCR